VSHPEPQPAGEPAGHDTSLGIEPGLAALLAYLFGWLSGLIVLLLEKQHREVRFHAAQSLIVFGVLAVFWIVVGAIVWIPVIGWIIGILAVVTAPFAIGLWIYLMVKGYRLEHVKLWVVGDYAEQLTTRI
jgi:uncharacterized membrane protein